MNGTEFLHLITGLTLLVPAYFFAKLAWWANDHNVVARTIFIILGIFSAYLAGKNIWIAI